ncbi:hypothetical protein SAMN05428642_1021133 [Flaviramulus basaltis]|uniref:Lipoprotein n=1 Tax=Flaviramulus basaltis TaxID=369401 RepID=A0A1K2IKR5_9FLAO|nr:hypothetical protein [Flaviramulus basaltis]SFZ93020.1 hypothetical protein SAMN05428642_1021133 [Flaviramulus basaltis]
MDRNPLRKYFFLVPLILFVFSCATHQRANIKADEEFVIELKKPTTRGGVIEAVIQGLFFGANYLAEESAKSLTSSYSQSISINDYYNTDLGVIEKTYKSIHIKKYSKPINKYEKVRVNKLLTEEFNKSSTSRGEETVLSIKDIIRNEYDDLLNFHAVIEFISDSENPGITKLSFNELRVFFSKTKIYNDEDLNAKVSILIEGQWRDSNGAPNKKTLIEQEYDFRNLKYGYKNQIKTPILSPWYYDIPIFSDIEGLEKYGVLNITIQLEEYEGNKSKYINKLPSILSDNKNTIISNGASLIKKL